MKNKMVCVIGVFLALAVCVHGADFTDELAKVLALGELTDAPAMWVGDTLSSPVATVSPGEIGKIIYFDALDYAGNATRVFAYVGIPAGAVRLTRCHVL